MYADYPVVPIIEAMVGQSIDIGTFAFLFGLVFFDYLPPGTPFPPTPADLGFFFAPGAISAELNPLYPPQ